MAMRIRVTTRADLFEERKHQHIERGYRIEDEQSMPVNGLCSFVAVREMPTQDTIADLVGQALNGKRAF
jgi:hypothetical protein